MAAHASSLASATYLLANDRKVASVKMRNFEEEARRCRIEARNYVGRPEQRLLLRIASAFDDLELGGVPGVLDQQTGPKLTASPDDSNR